jgi:peptide/nickel transport system substrate-binding protein
VLLALLALTACGAAPRPPTSDRPDPTASFRYADITAVDSLDPPKTNSSNNFRWIYPIFDRLLDIAPDGTLQPGLARSWSLEDGGRTVRLELDPRAAFSDRTPVDAAAVRANLERTKTLPEATSIVGGPVKNIAAIETPDATTVLLRLAKPDTGILGDLAQGPGMMMSPEGFDEAPDNAPIGAGPYTVQAFDPGHSLTLLRDDGYWAGAGDRVATISLTSMPDPLTRLNSLRRGQIDQAPIDASQIESARTAGLTVEIAPSTGLMNLYGNVSHRGLDDVRVRKAISLAIDRKALTHGLTFDSAEPTAGVLDRSQVPDRDLTAAKELLADAGYPPGTLRLSILILNRTLDKQLGESLQQMLGEAGIGIDLRVVDPARFGIYADGGTDMMVGRWNGRLDPTDTLTGIAGEKGTLNASRTAPPELTALLGQAARTPFGPERDAVLVRADRIVLDQQLTWPLYGDTLAFASYGCALGFRHSFDLIDDYSDMRMRSDCGDVA